MLQPKQLAWMSMQNFLQTLIANHLMEAKRYEYAAARAWLSDSAL